MTPNSFSDGKKFLDKDVLLSTLEHFKSFDDLIFDFGFESTAPMNSAITKEEEISRFNQFFEMIKDTDLNGRMISFDTYRPDSFRTFQDAFKRRYQDQRFIFNDVSGVIDQDLTDLLKSKINDPDCFYLFSSTRIPSRDVVLNHKNFADSEEDIYQFTKESFIKALDALSFFPRERLILDPCFGFSKTQEQNWELLERLPELFKSFYDEQNWLIGLSKKSFLRAKSSEYEQLHEEVLNELFKKISHRLLIRAHDPELVRRVYARS